MAGSDLKRRLEAMNGGPLVEVPPEREAEPEKGIVDLAEISEFGIPGKVVANEGGDTMFVVQCPLEMLAPAHWAADAAYSLTEFTPPGTACMDLETLGLSSEPLFLVGILDVRDGVPWLTQYLSRGYREEPIVIEAGIAHLLKAPLVVTFNGGSFDLPYLSRRAGAHGIKAPRFKKHRDVLVEARIKWAGQFRSFRLTSLEQNVLGRVRTHDLPGAAAPAAWLHFNETGDPTRLAEVLRHNAMDLAGTASLLGRLAG